MAQNTTLLVDRRNDTTAMEHSVSTIASKDGSCQVEDPQHVKCSFTSSSSFSSSGGESIRKSKVQFDDQITTISYEFDTKMRQHYWYRKTDYKRFQFEKKETLRHFRHAQSKFQRIQEDIFCLRGFEACLSARAVQQRLLRRVAALQAVLETQFDIRRLGTNYSGGDPQKKISSRYHKVTIPSCNQALQRAALDAAEVLEEEEEDQYNNSDNKNDDDQSTTTTSTSSSSSGSSDASEESTYLKNQIDRVMQIKAEGSVRRTSLLRSASSGPLMLRKSTANTA